jgi:HSP20 family protein
MQLLNKITAPAAGILNRIYSQDIIETGYRDYLNTIPFVNIIETLEKYQVRLAAPGMNREDFRIQLQGRTMTVSCENEEEESYEAVTFTKNEFNYSRFSRSFPLPANALTDKMSAWYSDGILKIEMPRKLELSNN